MGNKILDKEQPEHWGITEQEMTFADEYVFRYFHAPSTYSGMAVGAAKFAGYEVPVDVDKADFFAKSLLNKTQKYIDAEIERFREILSGKQRRNLWKYISDFKGGTPEQDADYGNIIRH